MSCQIKIQGNVIRLVVAASMLASQLAVAAPAPNVAAPATAPANSTQAAQQPAAVIPEDWAAAPAPDRTLVRRAVKESIEAEKTLAVAQSKEKAIPVRFTASSYGEQDKYEKFADGFEAAKVPGCLQPDGLKRQSTLIFRGLLALPFIAVAAIRGKCN